MIITASILQGLQVCAGPLPIHLFLLLTMIDLNVPNGCHTSTRNKETHITVRVAFSLLIINHVINCVHKFLFIYEFPDEFSLKPKVERYNKRMRFFVQIVQLTVFSIISYFWVFVP